MIYPTLHIRGDEHNSARDMSGGHRVARPGPGLDWLPPRSCGGKVSKYALWFRNKEHEYLYANTPSAPSPPFTFAAWLRKDVHNPSSYPIFLSFGLPYIACDGSTDPFRLSYRRASDSVQVSISGSTVPALGKWYHVAGVLDSGQARLYVNGSLEATGDAPEAASGSQVHIGTHSGSTNYRVVGRIDDVRVYLSALSEAEVGMVMDMENGDPVRLSLRDNGDVTMQGFEEDIEWDLLDSFLADGTTDAGGPRYDSAIGGVGINSTGELTAAGWSYNLTTINTATYTLESGFCQMFYSGGTLGWIEKTLPSGYDFVRVRWGNWFGGWAKLYVGGALVRELGANFGEDLFATRYSAGDTIKFEEGGIFWVGEIWVGKARSRTAVSPRKSPWQGINIRLAGRSPNLMAYDDWAVGTGSVGSFSRNGDDAENIRLWMEDPWGQPAIVWLCESDTVSGPDGGWNHGYIDIDPTVRYRYSVWAKRSGSTGSDGSFYHGCYGHGTTNGLYLRDTGALTTNPYFHATRTLAADNRWVLVVGHIWPAGSGTGSNYWASGRYNTRGTYGVIDRDLVWHPSSSQARPRTYLYYSTIVSRQWLVYPMFEKCDGTEAPLEDLLSGRAYHRPGRVPQSVVSMGGAKHRVIGSELHVGGEVVLR